MQLGDTKGARTLFAHIRHCGMIFDKNAGFARGGYKYFSYCVQVCEGVELIN